MAKLTFNDRKIIEKMLNKNISKAEIADVLECSRDTVYKEISRVDIPYKAIEAQKTL